MKESSIVSRIIREVKKAYPRIYIRKISDRFTRGMPDILIVAHCQSHWVNEDKTHDVSCGILFVECKTKKGKLSKLQEIELDLVVNNGGEVIVANTFEVVLDRLKDMGAV